MTVFIKQLCCLFVIFSILICCSTNSSNDRDVKYKLTHLMTQCKDLKIDTFAVFSKFDPDSVGFQFIGTVIDSIDITFFPKNIREQYAKGNKSYTCYKFKIDSSTTGLIIRTPSEYVSSSIKLFILDNENESIKEFIELAESIGDAGDVLEKTSWLFFDKNKNLNLLIWEKQSHENSLDENSYHLVQVNDKLFDTLKMTNESLSKQFDKLLH